VAEEEALALWAQMELVLWGGLVELDCNQQLLEQQHITREVAEDPQGLEAKVREDLVGVGLLAQ
jgi:hypothetical protein